MRTRSIRFLLTLVSIFCVVSAFADNTTYYAKLKATRVGEGKVYVSKTETKPSDSDYEEEHELENNEERENINFYLFAKPNSDSYTFKGWSSNGTNYEQVSTSNPYNAVVKGAERSPLEYNYFAFFVKNPAGFVKNNITWTPEIPSNGDYYFYHPKTKSYLRNVSVVDSYITSSTLFNITNLNATYISFKDGNNTKYVYESNGAANWGQTKQNNVSNQWKLESNGSYINGYVISHVDPSSKKNNPLTRYIQYTPENNVEYLYYKSNSDKSVHWASDDSYRTWQFISKKQYSDIVPDEIVKKSTDISGAVGTWDTQIETEYDNTKGVWAAKHAAVKGDNVKLSLTGVQDGIYSVEVNVSVQNPTNGKVYVKVNDIKSDRVANDGYNSYVVVAKVNDGVLDICVESDKDNVGDIKMEIIDIRRVSNEYTTTDMSDPWVEVTQDNQSTYLADPSKYLYAIWSDADTHLSLANGTNTRQGTAFMTMSYSKNFSINKLEDLWEFYKKDGKYVIVNASKREYMLQTDVAGSQYYRFKQNETVLDVNSAKMTIECTYGLWSFMSVQNNNYLSRWDTSNDVILSSTKSYYKLYAISRADYYALTQKIKYNATTLTPIDVSLFLANPEGLGTSGEGSTMLGWTRSGDCSLATYEDSKYALKSGKSYFGYYSNDIINGQPKGKMYQTISGLPAGFYVLSVKSEEPQTGVNLYMGSFSEALTSSIGNEVSVSGSVDNDGGSLTFGIELNDYQPHVNSKDQPDYYQLMFDKFELKYYGTDEVLAESVGNGEYYIRTNVGTDANPEYRYLEAGGQWGTSPIIGKHGFAYRLERNADGNTFAMESFVQEGTIGDYFNGKYNDRGKAISKIKFNQVHPDVNPLDYYIGFDTHTLDDNTHTDQPGGWLYPDGSVLNVKNSQDGSTVWQVVNELQRIKEMSGASTSNPIDATFFIKDPGFSRNDTRAKYWELGNGKVLHLNNDAVGGASVQSGSVTFIKGNNDDYKNDQTYHNYTVQIKSTGATQSFDMHQTIQSPNLPMGIYRIYAQGTAGSGTLALYAKDASGTELGSVAFDSHTFGSQKAAGDSFEAGNYRKSILVHVKESGLVIGFRGSVGTTASYVDNVEMEYLGEKPIDPADLTDERDVYIYNVDAGEFLTQQDPKNSSTGVVTSYAIVGTTGYLWTIKPKDGEAGKIAIMHNGMYLVPSNTTSTAIGLQTMVKVGDPYYWTVTVDADNPNNMIIKDDMGRLLEWNGDKAYNVLSGTNADVEPRGTRWQLYTASQYGKDRAFASTTSATRLANWPIVRAARVNMKNLTGDNAIEGLSDSYTAMDAVWQNIHASSSQITSVANEVKAKIVAAQNAKKGDVRNPIDVSFLINNANLGEGTSKESVATGWTVESGTWSAVNRAETIYPNKKNLINIGRFLWSTSASVLSQTVSNLPSGTYKLAVDVRGRTKPSVYSVTLVPSVSNGSDGREGTFSESSSITFGIKEVVTKYVVIKDDDATKDLKIRFALESGSVAFDNFRLLYCGKVTDEGDFRLITVNDNTEIELQGTWDINSNPELGNNYSALKDALSTNDIGAIHVYDENATVVGDLDLYNNYIKGTNTVVYTDINNVIGDANVIRRDKVDTVDGEDINYSCNNLVLTDKQGTTFLSIPYGFKASNVSFNRSVTPDKTDGFQWTNIVVPFDITSRPTGIIDFYEPMSLVDWESGKTTLRVVTMNEDGTLEHNTPALVKADGNISINEKNAYVYPTSELEKPVPDKPGMNLFGNYTKKYVVGGDATLGNDKNNPQDIPNADGLHANKGYYTNSNKFKCGNGWFNIGAFRAFIYDGSSDDSSSAARRGMTFDIEEWINAEITEIADVEEEVKIEAYYSVNGIRLDSPQKGVNIVKFSNGMKKKIFVK